MRTYVLDTSVLLSDPRAILRFDEHAVVLPVVVITELESKRHDPELGYFARTALRLLDGLRERHGRLDRPVPLNDEGGTLRVELNGTDDRVLPAGMRLGDNDTRILAVAVGLANAGADVTVVSKDMPMRIKASSVGLAADEYRAQLVPDSDCTGMTGLTVEAEQLDALWSDGALPRRSELEGGAHPRRRPARQPAGGPLGRDRERHRVPARQPPLRARRPRAHRAQRDRRARPRMLDDVPLY